MKAIKTVAATVILLVGLLVAVLAVRAAIVPSRQPQPSRAAAFDVDRTVMARRLAATLQIATISPDNPAQFNPQGFVTLRAYLEESFPQVHRVLLRERVSEHSLLYTWSGADPALRPVLLAAHLDTVPVEPLSEARWTHPPFEGRIADGHIWGRGAMDDKSALMAILEAVEALLNGGFHPRRTIYLAFGHDEEIGGRNGAAQIAALLRSRGVRLEAALDEGGVIAEGLMPGPEPPVALVGVAEKGMTTLELEARVASGHSSMPPPQTAIGVLSAAIVRIEREPLPARLSEPTRFLIEYLAPETPWPSRLVVANLWLFSPLVVRRMAQAPAPSAMVRTTTAVTMIEGGTKENVLPSTARAVVNFRILPGDTQAAIESHVRRVINDDRITVWPRPSGTGASPVSDPGAPAFRQLQRVIRQVFPEVIVAPYLTIGGTDGRHYVPLTDNVYRFAPLRAGPQDLARAHGIDERIATANYEECVRFYAQFLRVFGAPEASAGQLP